MVEAIRIVNELRKTPGTDQQKLITEISDQAKDNPLLPNLLNIAKRAGVTGLDEGEGECGGGGGWGCCACRGREVVVFVYACVFFSPVYTYSSVLC